MSKEQTDNQSHEKRYEQYIREQLQQGVDGQQIAQDMADKAFAEDTAGIPDRDLREDTEAGRQYNSHWATLYWNLVEQFSALVETVKAEMI